MHLIRYMELFQFYFINYYFMLFCFLLFYYFRHDAQVDGKRTKVCERNFSYMKSFCFIQLMNSRKSTNPVLNYSQFFMGFMTQ